MVKFRFYDPDDEETPKPAAKHHEPFELAPSFVPAATNPGARRGLSLDWVRELGWRENPFTSLRAVPGHHFIVNQDAARQALNLFFIKEQHFGSISGEQGTGKSFMLQWLAEELEPYNDRFVILRFSAQVSVDEFVRALVKPHESLLAKYKGNSPEDLIVFLAARAKKRIVLLFDHAHEFPHVDGYVKSLLEGVTCSVIVAGNKPKLFAQDQLAIKLQPLSTQDAIKLVEKRITAVGGSSIEPFTQTLLTELWKASKQNPATFLEYCNETAMKVALKQVTVHEEPAVDSETPKKPTGVQANKNSSSAKKTAALPSKNDKKQKSPYDDLINDLMK